MFYPTEDLKDKVLSAPFQPGCYIYRNNRGEVLYIGKAVNLRSRTRSYFQNFHRLDPRIKVLVEQINDVEYVTTDSELEALILETNLIKKYMPKYNRLMKDDKNYIWVMVPKNTDFPKIEFVREKRIKNADYFGPYPETMPIKRTLRRLRHIFPFRSCNRKICEQEENGRKTVVSSDSKPCLYFYLGLCNGPCTGKISKANYMKGINDIKRFFRGERNKIIDELRKEMEENSRQMGFEKAASLRDKIQDINYVTQTIKIDKDMDEVILKAEKQKLRSKALQELIEKLDIQNLKLKSNFKIETYDVSNIQGKNATSSMVVLIDGRSEKSHYRKFKIKTKSTPDDFEMMRETFSRRFARKSKVMKKGNQLHNRKSENINKDASAVIDRKDSDKSFDIFPDLIVVDGGKDQLGAAFRVLQEMTVDVPVIGLAKREEEIFKIFEKDGELDFKKAKISRKSEASYLLQNIRDEAHRFALGYHRKLRSKSQVKSILDDIPGIGKLTKMKLLKAFGSTEGVRKARRKDLFTIVRNRSTIDKIKRLL